MRMSAVFRVLIWSILVFPVLGHAGGFCLLLAENYYEQLYCEVKAQGGGKRLPSFYDFRKNNEMTQALLLRRPLAKIGVQIVLPRNIQTNAKAVNDPDVLAFTAGGDGEYRQDSDIDVQKNNRFGHYDFNKCFFEATHILCRGERYQLMANQANKKLSRGALAGDNRMAIPVFQGLIGDKEALGRYLSVAYQQYIQKMLEIGLGGSTFSYAKFVFLFQDVTSKGIDFSQRFETMFGFLKQDKQRLAVNEQPAKNVRVVKEQCDWLEKSLVVCDVGGKNYIYQSRSNNLMPNVSTTLENGVK